MLRLYSRTYPVIGRVRVAGYGSIMESIMETDYGSIIDHNRIIGSRIGYADYEVDYWPAYMGGQSRSRLWVHNRVHNRSHNRPISDNSDPP